MNKFLIYTLIFAAGILVSFFLFKGCGDKKKPTDNSTNNIEVIDDTLKVIQQDYKGQIATKEAIIMDLENVVKQLKEKAAKGSTSAAKLAQQIEAKNKEIERLGGEVQSLMFIVSTMKVKQDAPIIEIPNEDPAKAPSYYTIFNDSSEWYNATVVFDISQGQGSLNLTTRDEYSVTDYIGSDGVEYFRITNANPHVRAESGNLFKKPLIIEDKKKKRFGIGLQAGYGIGGDGFSPFLGVGLSYNLLRF